MDVNGLSPAEMMRLQAAAVLEAADRLDNDAFQEAVELVSGTVGVIVVSGAGTSGIIARKIAATLTSTGSRAVFLHPGDALHGSLGIVTPDDVAILISNSGETDELLALVPYLEHRKVPVVALVGNPRSTLAAHAAVVLDAHADREACPLNLAPTCSSSVALALGDALAMSVMQVRNVTPEQFARNHPSGRLGKRLTLRVDDLMRRGGGRPRVTPDTPWLQVVSEISEGGVGAVTVEDGEERLLGLITDGDLRRAVQVADHVRLSTLTAADVMTRQPVAVPTGTLAYDALLLMENRPSQISVLPVLDGTDRCVGLLRLHDLVRSGI